MAKKKAVKKTAAKKEPKKRNRESLKIIGTLDDVLKASLLKKKI